MIVGVVLLCILLFFRSRFVLLGVGVTCALVLHQIFDEMWTLPANWFYPLLGPFQGQMIPEYISAYFWLEISNPSEWMFMIATVAILAESYGDIIPILRASLADTLRTNAYTLVVAGLLMTGLYLVAAGLTGSTGTFISPSYYQIPALLAGELALCGAVIMRGETFDTPGGQYPDSPSGSREKTSRKCCKREYFFQVHYVDYVACRWQGRLRLFFKGVTLRNIPDIARFLRIGSIGTGLLR
jgi:hypothetical protein